MRYDIGKFLGRVPFEKKGVTAVEYALMAALVAAAIAATVTTLSGEIMATLNFLTNTL